MRKTHWLMLVLLAAAGPAQSQTGRPTFQTIPKPEHYSEDNATFRADTRVVLVDVVVADKSGRAITDLRPEDFQVLENGERQALSSFSLETPKQHTALASGSLPADVATNDPTIAGGSGSMVMVLVETLTTSLLQRQNYKDLERKLMSPGFFPAGTKIAVFQLSKDLTMLQGFTTNIELGRAALESALQWARKPRNVVPQVEAKFRSAQSTADPSFYQPLQPDSTLNSGGSFRSGFTSTDPFATAAPLDACFRIQQAMWHITAYARRFPGRKALIWPTFDPGPCLHGSGSSTQAYGTRSYGWDRRAPLFGAANAAVIDFKKTYNQPGQVGRRILREMNEAQVALYPLSIDLSRALTPDSAVNATDDNGFLYRQPSVDNLIRTADVTRSFDAFRAGSIASEGRITEMTSIAQETGGRAFISVGDLAQQFKTAIEDTSSYYLLSYRTGERQLNKYYEIAVKVNRPGAQVRHRPGYFVAPTNRSGSALRPAMSQLTAEGLVESDVVFLARSPESPRVGPQFLVGGDQITVRREGERWVGSVTFTCTAIDMENARAVQTSSQTLSMNMTDATFENVRKNGIVFRLPLQLGPGKYRLRMSVTDVPTQRRGSLDMIYNATAIEDGAGD